MFHFASCRPGLPPPNFVLLPPGMSPAPNSAPPPMHSGAFPPGVMPPNQMSGPPPQSFNAFAGPQAPRPPIAGTEWAENVAPDGKQYWYNIRTMQTTWAKPKQVEEAEQAQKEAEEMMRIDEERRRREDSDRMASRVVQ